jgi:hypothetical protein
LSQQTKNATIQNDINLKQHLIKVSKGTKTTMSVNNANEIIDWSEAMLQCGDDEEFLRELLGDLRTETQQQLQIINAVIQVSWCWRG